MENPNLSQWVKVAHSSSSSSNVEFTIGVGGRIPNYIQHQIHYQFDPSKYEIKEFRYDRIVFVDSGFIELNLLSISDNEIYLSLYASNYFQSDLLITGGGLMIVVADLT